MYSQGYRINFHPAAGENIITQTGGFFLKAFPKQAEIYIDDKFKDKTDFFFGSALIENLLPKKYKITVKKENYHSWEKTFEIKEKEVVDAKTVTLFPEDIGSKVLINNVEKFWPSADGKSLILMEKNGENWSLKLYDLNKNVKSHLINDSDISQPPIDLINLETTKDSKDVYLTVGADEEEKNFTLKTDKTPVQITRTKTATTSKNTVTALTINNDNYYLDILGYVFKNEEKINQTPFKIKQETPYNIYAFSDFVFLQEDKTLYGFNPESKSFEKFFEGIQGLESSPDSRKLVYFSGNEIWILFLKDNQDQPFEKSGDKVFLIRFSEKINSCFWLNSNYLIFDVNGTIKISETDNRDKINIIDLTEIKNPDFFWNKNDNKLYILNENNLYSSEPLLP
jgi:hypothetical protein